MFKNSIVSKVIKLTSLVSLTIFTTSTLALSEGIDWQNDKLIKSISTGSQGTYASNFDFPGVNATRPVVTDVVQSSCRERLARENQSGSSPIIANECDKKALFVFRNNTVNGLSFDSQR